MVNINKYKSGHPKHFLKIGKNGGERRGACLQCLCHVSAQVYGTLSRGLGMWLFWWIDGWCSSRCNRNGSSSECLLDFWTFFYNSTVSHVTFNVQTYWKGWNNFVENQWFLFLLNSSYNVILPIPPHLVPSRSFPFPTYPCSLLCFLSHSLTQTKLNKQNTIKTQLSWQSLESTITGGACLTSTLTFCNKSFKILKS